MGRELRETRRAAGLRQQDVAARAGVDQSMVSLYESGRREPTWPTFSRLLHAAGASAELRIESLPANGDGLTLVALADHLVAAGTDSRRRRLILDFVGRYLACDADRRVGLLLSGPGSVGDVRWDAVLGGLAEHLAFHDAVDAPAWCAERHRFLEHPWYWVDLPSVRRRAMSGAPTAFRRRNVWIDRSDLERI